MLNYYPEQLLQSRDYPVIHARVDLERNMLQLISIIWKETC
jgi:hypothetical protein